MKSGKKFDYASSRTKSGHSLLEICLYVTLLRVVFIICSALGLVMKRYVGRDGGRLFGGSLDVSPTLLDATNLRQIIPEREAMQQ